MQSRRHSSATMLRNPNVVPIQERFSALSDSAPLLNDSLTAVTVKRGNNDYMLLGIGDRNAAFPELVYGTSTFSLKVGLEPNTIDTGMAQPDSHISFTLDRFLSEESPWSTFTADRKP